MVLNCKDTAAYAGKDKDQVQHDCDLVTCNNNDTTTCAGNRHCTKRSLVSRSKEDANIFLGLVWCACPEQLASKRNVPGGVSVFASIAARPARRPAAKKHATAKVRRRRTKV
jgi:hypothetical protein